VTTFQRVFGAGGLALLGFASAVLIGTQVTQCLGPLGATYVQALANGCLEPGVGIGAPVFALWLAAAALWLFRVPRRRGRSAAAGAIVGATLAALGAVFVTRVLLPTTVTGPTSSGDVITFALPIDWNLIAAAGIAGGAVGFVGGSRAAHRPSKAVAVGTLAMLMAALVAGCQSALPTFPDRLPDGTQVLCGGVGFVGKFIVHGSPTDQRLTWMTRPDGGREELVWPHGYTARFTPGLEVLDAHGRVVAREGSLATGGCTMPPDGAWYIEISDGVNG
jgi:hypothetical protein